MMFTHIVQAIGITAVLYCTYLLARDSWRTRKDLRQLRASQRRRDAWGATHGR
jgi:hypothetical protein